MGNGFANPVIDNNVHKSYLNGPVRNAYEQEADRMAETAAASVYSEGTRSKSRINLRSAGQAIDSGYSLPVKESNLVSDTIKSSGRPLDESVRLPMESWFNHDFRGVRIHDDPKASESAKAVKAIAYTVGRDIVFRNGAYAPHANAGRELLAHELAHVVQQSGRKGFQRKADSQKTQSLKEQEYKNLKTDSQLLKENKVWTEHIKKIAKGIDDQAVIGILRLPEDFRAQVLINFERDPAALSYMGHLLYKSPYNIKPLERLNSVLNGNQFKGLIELLRSSGKEIDGDFLFKLADNYSIEKLKTLLQPPKVEEITFDEPEVIEGKIYKNHLEVIEEINEARKRNEPEVADLYRTGILPELSRKETNKTMKMAFTVWGLSGIAVFSSVGGIVVADAILIKASVAGTVGLGTKILAAGAGGLVEGGITVGGHQVLRVAVGEKLMSEGEVLAMVGLSGAGAAGFTLVGELAAKLITRILSAKIPHLTSNSKMKAAIQELKDNPPTVKKPGPSGFTPNEKGYMKEGRVRDLYGVPDVPEHKLPTIRSKGGKRRLDAPIIPASSYMGETTPPIMVQVKAVKGYLSAEHDLPQLVATIRSADRRKAIVMLHVDEDTKFLWNASNPKIKAQLKIIRNAIKRGRLIVRIGD